MIPFVLPLLAIMLPARYINATKNCGDQAFKAKDFSLDALTLRFTVSR